MRFFTDDNKPTNPELKFERLNTSLSGMKYRAKIPGGWIFYANTSGSAFIPDPNHEWDGGSLD